MIKRFVLPIGFAVLGVALLLIGINAGEVETVFHKAIAICMECIGIG